MSVSIDRLLSEPDPLPMQPAAPVDRLEPPLPSPAELRARLRPSETVRRGVERSRRALADVIHGRDPARLAVVVGPCSIHDEEQALVYAARLAPLADELSDELVVVMRCYLEKPRSSVGWKGFLNDPRLDGSCRLAEGLERGRALLLEMGRLGLACGAELLDPIAAVYLEDLLAWGCIGARTSESQIHRELASGLAMPVGFKNRTDGSLQVAHDGIVAARRPHSHLAIGLDGRPGVRRSGGNADAHLVLRGGGGVANHDAESVAAASARLRQLGLARGVWVDCSHGNSDKNPRLQGLVLREVLAQVRGGHRAIGGVMLESFLAEGRQDLEVGQPLRPGLSLTDACLGWDETEALLRAAAHTVRSPGAPSSTAAGALRGADARPGRAREDRSTGR